jgi:hypothetical protein
MSNDPPVSSDFTDAQVALIRAIVRTELTVSIQDIARQVMAKLGASRATQGQKADNPPKPGPG